MGNQSDTLLMREERLPSFWDNLPAWLHSKVQAKLSNDLTAVSDPNTAPAVLPTLVFGG